MHSHIPLLFALFLFVIEFASCSLTDLPLKECDKGVFLEDQVTFHLFHTAYLETGHELFINNLTSLRKSQYDETRPTIFIIHGWTHSRNAPWLKEMREVMVRTYMWNVIVVDWGPLSHTLYVEAKLHTKIVAHQLTKFCTFLRMITNSTLSDYHFVGHSLGAQISAHASYMLQQEIGEKIGRISGLDPAAPLYEYPDAEIEEESLDPSDADFVDVIHTNGNHLGVINPVGHVDFFPNGGETQPDCNFWICSHMRACEIWTVSVIKPDFFRTYKAKSWEDFKAGNYDSTKTYPMGLAANPYLPRGNYYLSLKLEELEPFLQTKTTIIDSFK